MGIDISPFFISPPRQTFLTINPFPIGIEVTNTINNKKIKLFIFLMVIIIIFGIHYIFSYIIIFFGFFVSGACIVIYYAEITKIFGILSGLKLLSINSIIIGIINLIMLCLKAFIFDKDFNYIIMHIFCIILCIVKMVISSYIKEKIIFSNPLDKKQNIGQIMDKS